MRLWRNWQTHQLEGLALAIAWWFESTQPHHSLSQSSYKCSAILRVPAREPQEEARLVEPALAVPEPVGAEV